MAALENQISTSDMVASLDVEMISNFRGDINMLSEILGLFPPETVAAGTTMYTYKVTGTLQSGTVAEGDEIPLSNYELAKTPVASIGVSKYRKLTTAEAILKGGYVNAITRIDVKMLHDIRSNIISSFFTYMGTGTGSATGVGLQAALAQSDAALQNTMETNGDAADRVIHFVNPLDLANYLATANVTTQTVFGLTYLQNFLGVTDIISTNKVPQGTIYVTPVSNIHIYTIDFTTLANAGLEYTFDDGNLIGVHHKPTYDRASVETSAMTGVMMLAENLDYIVKGTVSAAAAAASTLSSK